MASKMAGTFHEAVVDLGIAIARQHARKIVDQSAARDVSGGLEHARRQAGHQRLVVLVHAQQFVAQRALHPLELRLRIELQPVEKDAASQRIAIRMKPIRGEANEDISFADGGSVKHPGPINNADDRAGQIVFSRLIHAGHLSGLAPDERAAASLASLREAFEDLREDRGSSVADAR